MRESRRKIPRNNAEQVDALFRLMFETLWLSPYDPRRSRQEFLRFERQARRVALLLGATELEAVTEAEVSLLRSEALTLSENVSRLAAAGIFPSLAMQEARLVCGCIARTLCLEFTEEVKEE